jgi:hypothetical protein
LPHDGLADGHEDILNCDGAGGMPVTGHPPAPVPSQRQFRPPPRPTDHEPHPQGDASAASASRQMCTVPS